jgi:hypothetical protein
VSAVLRVFWLFYTAFPLQRWLAVVGAAVGAVLIVVGLLSSQARIGAGYGALTFAVFTAFPALFACAALLRALSAPRSHQLFPHFRQRALLAVVLLVTSSVLWLFGIGLAATALIGNEAVPAAASFVFPFGFVTAVFVWVWLFSADWRWWSASLLLPLGAVLLTRAARGGADTGSLLLLVSIGASLAWVAFAAWFLRVRRVRPVMVTPPARNAGSWTGQLTREAAMRATIAWDGQPSLARTLLAAIGRGGGTAIVLLIAVALLPEVDRLPYLTSFPWPFASMALVGGHVGFVVRQSRLLWLRVGGSRDQIWRHIELAAWQTGLGAFTVAMTTALIGTVAFGTSVPELLFGVALCASAAAYGGYVALAAAPGARAQVMGFGLMAIAQLALLARADPALISVLLVLGAQLLGAALLRALAVRRWRKIDWRLVRPWKSFDRVL